VLTAAIARSLGAVELGQYLLGFSFFMIFVSLASEGLKIWFTRELVGELSATSTYLVNGTLLQLALGVISYIALVAVVFALPYSDQTSNTCYIIGLTVIPFALSNITEAVFQAHEKMHLITISTVPIYILRLLLMIAAMQLNYRIATIAGILVLSECLIFIIEWIIAAKMIKIQWKINLDFIREIMLKSRTFFGIAFVSIISTRIEILLLSVLGDELQVGFYGGINQLMQPFLIVANSVALSIFPTFSKVRGENMAKQRYITENFIELLLAIALPFWIGLQLLGEDLLTLIYGSGFAGATLALQVASLTLIFMPFTRALSFLLVANGFERANLREILVTITIGSTVGVAAIHHYQLLGAALMDFGMSILASSQYIFIVYKRLFSLNIVGVITRPLLLTLWMFIVIFTLQALKLNLFLILFLSILIYFLSAGLLTLNSLGGLSTLRMKFLKKS
jgi:O-antigen/teichoic acid export membrane protein